MTGRTHAKSARIGEKRRRLTARVTTTVAVVALCLTIIVPAAQGTRQVIPRPIDPALCRIDPRPLPLWDGTPAAQAASEQSDPATGEPADDAILRGITSTIEESTACANAGQPLRTFALVTDAFLARQFEGDAAADVTEAGAQLERPEFPPSPEDYLSVVSIDDAVVYPDETVGAVVVTANATGTFTDYVILLEGDTRWLIDASFPLDEPPATPSP